MLLTQVVVKSLCVADKVVVRSCVADTGSCSFFFKISNNVELCNVHVVLVVIVTLRLCLYVRVNKRC